MEEIWKPVVGFEGLYEVSNLGRLKRCFGKILKDRDNGNGYLYACLYKCGKPSYRGLHRVVALAFIPNPNKYECVNHIDFNKHNNSISNLEWCNQKSNVNYSLKNNRMPRGESSYLSKFKEKDILKIRANLEKKPILQLANEYSVTKGAIEAIIKRKTWKHLD